MSAAYTIPVVPQVLVFVASIADATFAYEVEPASDPATVAVTEDPFPVPLDKYQPV